MRADLLSKNQRKKKGRVEGDILNPAIETAVIQPAVHC